MAESKLLWLSDTEPTLEDHLTFALDRQRERLQGVAQTALGILPISQLQEIIQLSENANSKAKNTFPSE